MKKHWFVVEKNCCKLPSGAWAAPSVLKAQGELHCKEELAWFTEMGDVTWKVGVLDVIGKAAAVATL